MPHLANTLYAAAALPLRCLPAAQRLTAITAVLVQCLALGACGGGSTATDSAVVTLRGSATERRGVRGWAADRAMRRVCRARGARGSGRG